MAADCNERAYMYHYFKHTWFVVLAWKEIQDLIIANDLITEEEFQKINQLIIWHDNSKISKEEWLPYARRFNPIGNLDKDTVKREFKEAVRHHKSVNIHHFENLRTYEGPYWRCYIIEMICDFIAMGWELGHYIFEYYEEHKHEMQLPVEYQEYLDRVLEVLRDPSMHYIEEPLTTKRMTYLEFKD